jgi:tetrapyrrole methylase family protein / MazG family protein
MKKAELIFKKFIDVVKALRTPGSGCPWDLEQTHCSIRPYLLEETYEVLEAIDKNDDKELANELGDLLLQVVLHAQIASDRNAFDITDVTNNICEKMIRRHPHVFGDEKFETAHEVLKNWEQIKLKERTLDAHNSQTNEPVSILSGIPTILPALLRAQRLGEKASKANFDWASAEQVWQKVEEELGELKDELTIHHSNNNNKVRLSSELGDLLFSLCQLARWLEISAEDSLREAANKFTSRFMQMEQNIKKPLSKHTHKELDQAWEQTKTKYIPT